MRRSSHTIAALSLIVAASPTPGQAAARQRDSAGVRVVVNHRADGGRPAFALAPIPLCVIRGDGSRGHPDLTAVPGAVLLSDNRLVVADGAERRLYFYRCPGDGSLLYSRGSAGKGPGEFTSISALHRRAGDTLLVAQTYVGQLVTLDPSGKHVRSNLVRGNVLCCFDDGSIMLGRSTPPAGQSGATSSMWYYRYDWRVAGGDSQPVAVLPMSEASVSERRVARGANSVVTARVLKPRPFGRMTSVRPLGTEFVVGTGPRYEIAVYDPGGRLVRLIRVDEPTRAVGSRERQRYIAAELEGLVEPQLSRRRNELAAADFPAAIPAFRRIETDDSGRLWVERYPMAADEEGWWDVFTSAGTLIGGVAIPTRNRVMSVRSSDVLLRAVDDDGVVELRVYHVRSLAR